MLSVDGFEIKNPLSPKYKFGKSIQTWEKGKGQGALRDSFYKYNHTLSCDKEVVLGGEHIQSRQAW